VVTNPGTFVYEPDGVGQMAFTATFTHLPGLGATSWYIDWGDGNVQTIQASGDGETSDVMAFSHDYVSNYSAFWTVKNLFPEVTVFNAKNFWQTAGLPAMTFSTTSPGASL